MTSGKPTLKSDGLAKYNIPDAGYEYEKVYPTETKRIAELRMHHSMNNIEFAMIENGGQAFQDEDFTTERQIQRWRVRGPQDTRALSKFLSGAREGDIYERDPIPYAHCSDGTKWIFNQILRNTTSQHIIFEFGRTYVGFVYVDLCQLMWGAFRGEDSSPLKFFGYDQAEVTVARSLLIF